MTEYPSMNVELVILGSSSMKSPHCNLMRSNAFSVCPAARYACSSKPPANGEMVVGFELHSGAGAPYWPHRAFRLVVMELTWEELRVKFAKTGQDPLAFKKVFKK